MASSTQMVTSTCVRVWKPSAADSPAGAAAWLIGGTSLGPAGRGTFVRAMLNLESSALGPSGRVFPFPGRGSFFFA